MRRSFVKGQNGVRGSPDVKISEEQSDKSGTDPEDTDENYSQADITDYRNYEQLFRLVFTIHSDRAPNSDCIPIIRNFPFINVPSAECFKMKCTLVN